MRQKDARRYAQCWKSGKIHFPLVRKLAADTLTKLQGARNVKRYLSLAVFSFKGTKERRCGESTSLTHNATRETVSSRRPLLSI
jgi:hypothetical protein